MQLSMEGGSYKTAAHNNSSEAAEANLNLPQQLGALRSF